MVIVDWATELGPANDVERPVAPAPAVTPSAVCSSDDQFGVPLLVDVDVAADADNRATASAPTPTMGSRAASSGPVYLFISVPSPGGAPRATATSCFAAPPWALCLFRRELGRTPFSQPLTNDHPKRDKIFEKTFWAPAQRARHELFSWRKRRGNIAVRRCQRG